MIIDESVTVPPRRHSRLIVMIGLVALIVVIAAAIWMVTHGGASASRGPLTTGNPTADGIVPTTLETPVTIGDWSLTNSGDEPAVVDSITVDNPDPGLRVIGIKLARYGKVSPGAVDGYPVKGLRVYRVDKLPIPPGQDPIEIIVGFKIDKPGRYTSQGLTVVYHVGNSHYQTTVPEAVAVCYPVSSKQPCEAKLPTP
jgi:hypothetical protein